MHFDSEVSKERPSSLHIKDIFCLTEQETDTLRERINSSDGKINILVHPFFHEDDPVSKRGPSEAYLANRNEAIRRSFETNTQPLIVFEEAHNLPSLQTKLQGEQGSLLIVPTHPEQPVPHLSKESDEPHEDNIAWARLKDLFDNLGVKSAEVGGRYLYFAGLVDSEGIEDIDTSKRLSELKGLASEKPNALEWLNKGLLPYGCAGTAAQKLIESGFDVSLSKVSSPDVYEAE